MQIQIQWEIQCNKYINDCVSCVQSSVIMCGYSNTYQCNNTILMSTNVSNGYYSINVCQYNGWLMWVNIPLYSATIQWYTWYWNTIL